MRWVGLDVHAQQTVATVFCPGSGEVEQRRIDGRAGAVVEWLADLPRPLRAVYEAGPTGYALARAAAARGLDVAVCAPGHIGRHPSDRIKTDARDSLRLARLYAAGELKLVRVPSREEEQLRDLVRAREDVRLDLMRVRHRISKLCLRRELHFVGPGKTWTLSHRDWLSGLSFADRPSQVVFDDYRHAHDHLLARRDVLERALEESAVDSPWARTIGGLRCLRGIDTLSASGLCAEVGDFCRFQHPKLLTSQLGLVPSENSSGERRRLGSITKAGSKHARRLLVEAAWHYRRPPRVSATLARRQHAQDPRAIEIAWRAQRRLHQRWQRLQVERGKRSTVVAVAVARELATFCWEIATLD
ncbi:MAG TPA: IS110 family transposase [Mycobacteriales bacterium]|jgi:transposase|nr:IS110 family transposase [Mycobacteriales bacterium]